MGEAETSLPPSLLPTFIPSFLPPSLLSTPTVGDSAAGLLLIDPPSDLPLGCLKRFRSARTLLPAREECWDYYSPLVQTNRLFRGHSWRRRVRLGLDCKQLAAVQLLAQGTLQPFNALPPLLSFQAF